MNELYLYSVSRRDLPNPQQAIQCGHAAFEYWRNYGKSEDPHPTFVWFTVENKWELMVLKSVLKSNDLRVSEFHDPDYPGYDPSAIACLVSDEKRHLFSHLPLWREETTWQKFVRWVNS